MSDHLQEPVAYLAVLLHNQDQRLVRQLRQHLQHLIFFEISPGAHSLSSFQGETSRKHTKLAEEGTLILTKQLVAPIHRRPERPVVGHRRSPATREQPERLVHPAGDLLH